MITGAFFFMSSGLLLYHAVMFARRDQWRRAMVCAIVSVNAFTLGCVHSAFIAINEILEQAA